MNPENYIVTTFTISMEEFEQIFPWFENLIEEQPKKRRGRKPKAHHVSDKVVEMKASN